MNKSKRAYIERMEPEERLCNIAQLLSKAILRYQESEGSETISLALTGHQSVHGQPNLGE